MMFTFCRKLMFLISERQMLLLAFGMVSASGPFVLESLAAWQLSFHLGFLALSFVLFLL